MKQPVEVRAEHIDDQNLHHVDVYFTDDDMEEGKTACVVCRDTKKVIYFDNIYRNSPMVQEAIQEILKDIDEEGERKLEELNEYLKNIDPDILPDNLIDVELTPSQMIQQIQVKALQSGGTFTLANGGAVATSLGYVCEFGKEDVCMTDATYEDYGNFDDTDIENMYHAIF